ncbi:MAG: sucrase ferredoxin [Dermatophilaceae bacterium]
MSDPFRCSVASQARADDLAGTASTVRAFLLVEHPGPWGSSALRDARLPRGFGPELARQARNAGVRPLLVRRHRQRRLGRDGVRILASHTGRQAPWLEQGVVSRWEDVLDIDLAALGVGRSIGMAAADGPLFAVCTHGRHDPCCAEWGRPVAAALAAIEPQHAWECSHIGGDRFAGNVLVLPDGIYYGRIAAEQVTALVATHRSGRLDLPHLRGWSAQPVAVQVAELALRRQLGDDRIGSVVPGAIRRDGRTTTVRLDADGIPWTVVATHTPSDELARLTCHARHADRLPSWQVAIHPGEQSVGSPGSS